MCTLYKVRQSQAEVARLFGARPPQGLPATEEELYPGRVAPVVRREAAVEAPGLVLDAMRWGFPPPPGARAPVVNVRNLASPFWRTALALRERRCLVPVSEFCEYEGEKGAKRKRWFRLVDRELFAFAGLWRPVTPQDGIARAFAFLTCEPNPLVAAIHPQAMPVILHPEDHPRWLDADAGEAAKLAAAFPSQLMRVE